MNAVTHDLWDEVMQKGKVIGHPKVRITYIYDHKRRLRGAVVNDGTHVGYSYSHKNDLRKCSRKLSRKIALGRMLTCGLERDDTGSEPIWFRTRRTRTYCIPREVYPLLDALAIEARWWEMA